MWNRVEQCLSSPAHAWSMGSFGAIGAFMWADGESRQHVDGGRLGWVTSRGGLLESALVNIPNGWGLGRTAP